MEIKNKFSKRNIGDSIYCEIDLGKEDYLYFQEAAGSEHTVEMLFAHKFTQVNTNNPATDFNYSQTGNFDTIDFKDYNLPISKEYIVTHSYISSWNKLIIVLTKIPTNE